MCFCAAVCFDFIGFLAPLRCWLSVGSDVGLVIHVILGVRVCYTTSVGVEVEVDVIKGGLIVSRSGLAVLLTESVSAEVEVEFEAAVGVLVFFWCGVCVCSFGLCLVYYSCLVLMRITPALGTHVSGVVSTSTCLVFCLLQCVLGCVFISCEMFNHLAVSICLVMSLCILGS